MSVKIAYIQAGWHQDIVEQCFSGLNKTLKANGFDTKQIDRHEVPGSLEIPLSAKKLANTGDYALIVAAGLIVDGGIYRHDFVANAVLQGMMQVQLETQVPILSVVLTPHHFHEHDTHKQFFKTHFVTKGEEAASACLKMLASAC